MTITLTGAQQSRLEALVAAGEFASVEQAARQLIDERIAERATEEAGDLAWAKSHVEDARAAVARGEFVTLEDYKAQNSALLASLEG